MAVVGAKTLRQRPSFDGGSMVVAFTVDDDEAPKENPWRC
jgi:hypothetical protein